MRRTGLLILPVILLLAPLVAGCSSVAAGLACGVLLATGDHMIKDTAVETVALPISEAEEITRQVFRELSLHVLEETPTRQDDGRLTRWNFEAGVAIGEVVSVDVVLEKVSKNLTRITVEATKGWLRPDLATAQAVIMEISIGANRKAAQARPIRTGFAPGG